MLGEIGLVSEELILSHVPHERNVKIGNRPPFQEEKISPDLIFGSKTLHLAAKLRGVRERALKQLLLIGSTGNTACQLVELVHLS